MSVNTEIKETPEVITIQEEVDGSATIELPDSIPPPTNSLQRPLVTTITALTKTMRPHDGLNWLSVALLMPMPSACESKNA